MDDAYTALGIQPGATSEEIDSAYRRLVRRYPPELNPRRFARIKEAHNLLSSYEQQMREVAFDPEHAIDLVSPAPVAKMLPPPPAPEPLVPADWQPFLRPLREMAISAILVKHLGR